MEKELWSLEKIKKIVEENGFINSNQLRKYKSGAFTFLYRRNLLEDVFPNHRKKGKRVRRKDTSKVYDVSRVIGYLERWAEEEGITVEKAAYLYGYTTDEWEKYQETARNTSLVDFKEGGGTTLHQ